MPPQGVCCTHGTFGALVCQETTEQTCVEEFLGSWLGPGTVCDNQGENGNPFPCDVNTPFSCCDTQSNNCFPDDTRTECENRGVDFRYGGTPGCPVDANGDSLIDCRPLLACYGPPSVPGENGSCFRTSFEDCINLGGCPQAQATCSEVPTFFEHDTIPDDFYNPTVSCCIEQPDGIVTCEGGGDSGVGSINLELCLLLEGSPRCPNFCFDNSDPGNPIPLVDCGLFGACCLANGNCVIAEGAEDCDARPGTYQGNGIICSDDGVECVDEPHPCCFTDGTCEEELTQLECHQRNGQWFPFQLLCADVNCDDLEGCHTPRDPFYQPGDVAFTSSLCETAIAGITKRNQVINHQAGDFPESDRRMELLTSHKIKGCYFGAQTDPCEYHYIVMSKRHDGYLVPMAWSEPNDSGSSSTRELNRWNAGFFTKQVNDDGTDDVFGNIDDPDNERADSVRIEKGYLHARVGIEQEVWSELAIHSLVVTCCGPYK